MKRTIRDIAGLKGKVVLLRVDFNVPIDDNGRITDYTRILAALPTIEYLTGKGAKVVCMSHLGRPKGYEINKSLWKVALFLMKKLKCGVSFSTQVIGDEVRQRVKAMKDGDFLLLENVRFYEEESACDKKFSQEIASLGDIYINDAFATAHRENASTYGVARILPNAVGFLMEKEITELSKVVANQPRPFVAVIGGAKISTKINVLESLLDKADKIIIGGAMAYTFLVAMGKNVGSSMYEQDKVEVASEILRKAEAMGKKIVLPIDHVCVRKNDPARKTFAVQNMTTSMVAYDIGPKTINLFEKELKGAKLIFWNGPMGLFEIEKYSEGTFAIAQAIAHSRAHTIAGGGDTISAINKLKLAKKFNFVSTGGGATLEFLEKGSLPCIDIIQEKIL